MRLTTHNLIAGVFLWVAMAIFLDLFKVYYYFSALMYEMLFAFGITLLTLAYFDSKKDVYCSIMLSALIGWQVCNLVDAANVTRIYLTTLSYNLATSEKMIEISQSENMAAYILIGGASSLTMFFVLLTRNKS